MFYIVDSTENRIMATESTKKIALCVIALCIFVISFLADSIVADQSNPPSRFTDNEKEAIVAKIGARLLKHTKLPADRVRFKVILKGEDGANTAFANFIDRQTNNEMRWENFDPKTLIYSIEFGSEYFDTLDNKKGKYDLETIVAAVIAHEFGHHANFDVIYQTEIHYESLSQENLLKDTVLAAELRETEKKADLYGVDLLLKAGYDPKVYIGIFDETLWKQLDGVKGLLVHTHPYDKTRMEYIEKYIAQRKKEPEAGKERQSTGAREKQRQHTPAIKPRVSMSPQSGTVGTTFTNTGSGFTPNNTAIIMVRRPDGSVAEVAKVRTESSGSFSATWTAKTPGNNFAWWAVDNTTGGKSNEVVYNVFPPAQEEQVTEKRQRGDDTTGKKSNNEVSLMQPHVQEIPKVFRGSTEGNFAGKINSILSQTKQNQVQEKTATSPEQAGIATGTIDLENLGKKLGIRRGMTREEVEGILGDLQEAYGHIAGTQGPGGEDCAWELEPGRWLHLWFENGILESWHRDPDIESWYIDPDTGQNSYLPGKQFTTITRVSEDDERLEELILKEAQASLKKHECVRRYDYNSSECKQVDQEWKQAYLDLQIYRKRKEVQDLQREFRRPPPKEEIKDMSSED